MFSLPQLIGIPYDASSSFLRGAAAAPPLIRAAMTSPAGNSFTESGADLTGLADAGDLALGDDAAAARAAIQAGIAAMLENGFRPISLGGDHSITYPIMRAIAKRHRGVTILHIDAHADLYDEYEGDRYSHACPFARIMEEDLCARLVQVGIRTLDPAPARTDRAICASIRIEMQHFAGGARPAIDGPVYLSVDLDGLDPAFAPGVSHREPGGLSVRDVLTMIHSLQRTDRRRRCRRIQSLTRHRRPHGFHGGEDHARDSGHMALVPRGAYGCLGVPRHP